MSYTRFESIIKVSDGNWGKGNVTCIPLNRNRLIYLAFRDDDWVTNINGVDTSLMSTDAIKLFCMIQGVPYDRHNDK